MQKFSGTDPGIKSLLTPVGPKILSQTVKFLLNH